MTLAYLAALVLLLPGGPSTAAQADASQTQWVYRARIGCDPTVAVLDAVALQMQQDPAAELRAIAHLGAHGRPGAALRPLWYVARYLTNERGLDASRVALFVGPREAEPTIELRLVPRGAGADESLADVGRAYRFVGEYDEGLIGASVERGRAVLADAMEMCELEVVDIDGFARAIKETEGGRGVVLLHPGQSMYRSGTSTLKRAVRDALTQTHGLRADQFEIRVGRPRAQQSATLLVEAGGTRPKSGS